MDCRDVGNGGRARVSLARTRPARRRPLAYARARSAAATRGGAAYSPPPKPQRGGKVHQRAGAIAAPRPNPGWPTHQHAADNNTPETTSHQPAAPHLQLAVARPQVLDAVHAHHADRLGAAHGLEHCREADRLGGGLQVLGAVDHGVAGGRQAGLLRAESMQKQGCMVCG